EQCSPGPLYPGGWETEPRPDAARCGDFELPGVAPSGLGYRPLVYSVGGLRRGNYAMPGTRDQGQPRLAATAIHAVAGVTKPTTTLTGTSVAAAVASGGAALLWSYRSSLEPAEVMELLYWGGTSTTRSADYVGPEAESSTMRKIDVCGALALACTATSGCPVAINCSAPPLATQAELESEIALVPVDVNVPVSLGATSSCTPGCGLPRFGRARNGLGDGCPVAQPPELPFTEPQPSQLACPNCSVNTSTSVVSASLDSSYDGYTVQDVTVVVDDGAQLTYLRAGYVPLSSSTVTTIDFGAGAIPGLVRSVKISITFAELPRPQENVLIIE
ncbi:MAG: S8 family serine peptidase, partial [Myxococcales bacterium]|nr:S8 family serine peptidase [Myxococcales bacterium]